MTQVCQILKLQRGGNQSVRRGKDKRKPEICDLYLTFSLAAICTTLYLHVYKEYISKEEEDDDGDDDDGDDDGDDDSDDDGDYGDDDDDDFDDNDDDASIVNIWVHIWINMIRGWREGGRQVSSEYLPREENGAMDDKVGKSAAGEYGKYGKQQGKTLVCSWLHLSKESETLVKVFVWKFQIGIHKMLTTGSQ